MGKKMIPPTKSAIGLKKASIFWSTLSSELVSCAKVMKGVKIESKINNDGLFFNI
jgi:hypothetical protein